MFFPATTDKLQIVTSSTAALDVTAHYVDGAAATLVPSGAGRQLTAIITATTTDVLAAPAASTTRTLKRMTARNKDASLTQDVTVVYDANGTDYEMYKVTLKPQETLEYIEGIGFFVIQITGLLEVRKIMGADYVNATTSFTDITGLTYPLKSGIKYAIDAALFHTGDATTTGHRFGYNIGAAPTLAFFGNLSGTTNAVATGVVSLGTATARDTSISGATTTSNGTTATYTRLAGMIQPSADGTFALRGQSEVAVAAGLTVKAGSWMHIRQEG